MMQILIADKLGRIRFMQLACIIVTIGCTIQTASVNLGMFLTGRVISGVAVGSVLKPTDSRDYVTRINNVYPEP